MGVDMEYHRIRLDTACRRVGDGAAIFNVNGSRNVIPHQSGWRNRQNQFIRWPIAPWQYDAR
jgi:hypothetical protein